MERGRRFYHDLSCFYYDLYPPKSGRVWEQDKALLRIGEWTRMTEYGRIK